VGIEREIGRGLREVELELIEEEEGAGEWVGLEARLGTRLSACTLAPNVEVELG